MSFSNKEQGVVKEALLPSARDIDALVRAEHQDPFSILGPHGDGAGGQFIRAYLPDALSVQVVGKVAVAIGRSSIDFLSLSAHKFHGPKGVGALYVRRGTRFKPMIRGGHQERGRRAGTENVAGIVGLGVAAELATLRLPAMAVVAALRDELEQALLAAIPHCFVTGDVAARVPNTSTIAFSYVEGEAILLLLNQLGIAASSGSACTSGALEPSHVMRAMGVPYTAAHGAIRFSLSTLTTPDDVRQVIDAMPGIISRLRTLSPYWQGDGPQLSGFSPEFAGVA